MEGRTEVQSVAGNKLIEQCRPSRRANNGINSGIDGFGGPGFIENYLNLRPGLPVVPNNFGMGHYPSFAVAGRNGWLRDSSATSPGFPASKTAAVERVTAAHRAGIA